MKTDSYLVDDIMETILKTKYEKRDPMDDHEFVVQCQRMIESYFPRIQREPLVLESNPLTEAPESPAREPTAPLDLKIPYSQLPVTRLRKMAQEKKIKGYTRMNATELAQQLEALSIQAIPTE